jgi:hypothetical protein
MSVLDSIPDSKIKDKIRTGIYYLKSERLNQTTLKLAAEKKRVLEQQRQILADQLTLIEKENRLKQWEQELSEREMQLIRLTASMSPNQSTQ